MSVGDANMSEEAAGWFIRQRDPARADWDGFIAWLEADPKHNAAYGAVALADDEIGELAALIRPAEASNDNLPLPGRSARRWFAGLGGGAALVVAALVGWPLVVAPAATYAIETAAGQHRTVTLTDGTRIELNGGSRITLDKADTRFASLDRGEAAFSVVHDDAHPFEVKAGDTVLRDVGTVFDVIHTGDGVEAAVAQGAVMFNPDSDAVRLDAGRMIRVSANGSAVIGKVDPQVVGAWRQHRLVYQDASLARIAADLSRNLGAPVTVAPELAHERFSGVILLGDDRPRMFARIAALLDVDAVADGQAWHLAPRKGASR
jgi:transmembrane sensor